MNLEGTMTQETRIIKSLNPKDGEWASFVRGINYDWGCEEIQRTETLFIFNMPDIKKRLIKSFYDYFTLYLSAVENISKLISLTTEAFFESLTNTLENIRASLFESISDQQRNADVQEKVILTLDKLFKDSNAILNDTNLLKNDVQNLLENEVSCA